MELLRHPLRQEAFEIGGGSGRLRGDDLQQALVFDLEVSLRAAPAPALAAAGEAALLHVDEHNFERQAFVREAPRDVDEREGDVGVRAAFGDATTAELGAAAAIEFHQQLVGDVWSDDADAMLGEELANLLAER